MSHLFWWYNENYGFRGIINAKKDLLDIWFSHKLYIFATYQNLLHFELWGENWKDWSAPLKSYGWQNISTVTLGGLTAAKMVAWTWNLMIPHMPFALYDLGWTITESWTAITNLWDAIKREPQQPPNEMPATWHKYLWCDNEEDFNSYLKHCLLPSHTNSFSNNVT